MFPSGKPRVERSKTPEQIREEAAKATAADLKAICGELGISPSGDMELQVAAQLFWRHRDEISAEATTLHFCPPDDPCDAQPAPAVDDKVTH
jgi:hypothetical protein